MVSFRLLSIAALLLALAAATTAQFEWSPDFECQQDSDCQNGGSCILMQGEDHYCQCPPGYGGQDCSAPCDHECLNGGSCRMRQMGQVVREYCECPPHQFMGPKCEISFTRCPGKLEVKCFHGGTCERGSDGYQCTCPADRTGAFCQLAVQDPHTASSSNNKDDDAKSVQLAFLLLAVALAGAGFITMITICYCGRRKGTIDTRNEVDVTSPAQGRLPEMA